MSYSQPAKKTTLLPGFSRPLDYIPEPTDPDYVGDLFKNALNTDDLDLDVSRRTPRHLRDPPEREGPNVAQKTVTLRELEMLRFMNSVTDKPDWFIKVNDEEIATKWKNEVCGAPELDFTPRMADWCIDELRHVASIHVTSAGNSPPIFVFNGDVVKSDTAVSPELKQALQDEVKVFEAAIPKKLMDWHPGSDGKVLDLVHPSLFPLVYGKTRILPEGETTTLANCIERCGEGEIIPRPDTAWGFSTKFQWLPCDVDISGGHARITSYINNLHPHRETRLYELIEKLIDASVPLWNASLAPLADQSFVRHLRIPYTVVTYDPDPKSWPDFEKPEQRPGEREDDFWERRQRWIEETRRLVVPEPDSLFDPLPQPAPFDLKGKYGERGLQIIAKLATIYLTHEKPEYGGGTWHVEGQLNEHIVATSLYYYSTENTTTSALSFRQLSDREVESEVDYQQDDHEWLTRIFGCKNDSENGAVQYIGAVETREGRLLAFPNVLQHRVEPFKLADPTKPGHRRIVALFLVDPNLTITSTANVPCQQQDWWWEAAISTKLGHTSKAAVTGIPIELEDGILEDVDFPFSLKEAKALRLELMEERKDFSLRNKDAFEQAIFSLCEH